MNAMLRGRSVHAVMVASMMTLAACGSGGGGSSGGDSGGGTGGGTGGGGTGGGTTITTAEGFWAGPTTLGVTASGSTFLLTKAGVILENGEYWFLLDVQGQVVSLVQGSGTMGASTFSGTSGVLTPVPGTADFLAGSMNASSYVARTSFRGGFRATGSSTDAYSYEMSYDNSYSDAAPFSLGGSNWTGSVPLFANSKLVPITLTAAGAISGTDADGCSVSGTLTQRRSTNARVYTASVTYGGSAPCQLPSTAFTGIAELTSNSPTDAYPLNQRVLIKTLDASRTLPLVILVDR